MSTPVRLLILAPEPDRRRSTDTLELIARELAARPGVHVDVWFLRRSETDPWWGRARVVDDLRTRPVARLADLVGLHRVAGAVRGRTLRRWWAEAAPDVVLLDDAVGGRVIPRGATPKVVPRWNRERSTTSALEEPWTGPAALHLAQAVELIPPDASGDVLVTAELTLLTPRDEVPDPIVLGAGEMAIVGFGSDDWIDGPDLFIRVLWALEHRFDRKVHGVWYLRRSTPEQVDRLHDEAERCGVGARFHLIEGAAAEERWRGDVVLLPYRGAPTAEELRSVLLDACEVVTMAPGPFDSPFVHVCDPLDVEAAAAEVEAVLARGGRRTSAMEIARQLDVTWWADEFLARVAPGGAG